jgi:6-phosphogluconate dehydrogenase (decarboxylating)
MQLGLVGALAPPRSVWLMVPAVATGQVVDDLADRLATDRQDDSPAMRAVAAPRGRFGGHTVQARR